MTHDFFLMDRLVVDLTSSPTDYILHTSIDDDLILYFMDFIKWIPSFNPAKSEIMTGICYNGVTVIYKDGAIIFNKILNGIISIFQCAPESFSLTGNDLIEDGNDYFNNKIICLKSFILQIINDLIKMTLIIIESNDDLYILHRGI